MKTASIALILLLTAPAFGMMMMPRFVPLERILPNAEAYVAENPEDPHGYYVLGRVYYMAFAKRMPYVGSWDPDEKPPSLVPEWMTQNPDYYLIRLKAEDEVLAASGYTSWDDAPQDQRSRDRIWKAVKKRIKEIQQSGWSPGKYEPEEALVQAASAERYLKKALKLKPDDGLYLLGLASLYKQSRDLAEDVAGSTGTVAFPPVTWNAIRQLFFDAYAASINKDLSLKYQPLNGYHRLVGYEAGDAYIKLVSGAENLSKNEEKQVAQVQRDLKKLSELPPGPITPIVFSLSPAPSLEALLLSGAAVRFDLDGDGISHNWSWVKPSTGFLVWDPEGKGRITSGRQLFGNATWWLLFENGYQALALLDDDRNGWVAGDEMEGLAVWFDRDSDGVSDPGEVVSLEKLGVSGLNTHPEGVESGSQMCREGIRMRDGRTLPSWDWVAERRP